MNASLTSIGELLLRASWQAGVLALIIFTIQWIAGPRLGNDGCDKPLHIALGTREVSKRCERT